MPLTPEQYYKNKKWPIIRHPAEKKSIIFSYEDLIDFADSYHLEKIVEAEALGASPVNLVVLRQPFHEDK